jgi:hypothetical protein
MAIITCRPKSLPLDRFEAAARRALEINPENATERRRIVRTPAGRRGGERRIAVVVARKWPSTGVRLSVSFLDTPPEALRQRILRHMNAWGESANVLFSETDGVGEVRIARLDSPEEDAGYWSYVGTEILEIEPDKPTLNLEGFTMRISDEEFRRVVRHEAGHTLGFDHEHMRSDIVKRIDRKKAIAYYDRTDGWTPEEVEEQVLTPLPKASIMGTTDSDPLSIMCYHLPWTIMKDRKGVKGGSDINPKDFAFAASLYPKPADITRGPANTGTPLSLGTSAVIPPALAAPSAVGGPRDDEDTDTFHLIVMDEFQPEVKDAPSDAKSDAKPETPKFARVLATYAGARVSGALRLRKDKDGPKTFFGDIIGMHERITKYTNFEEGTLPDDEAMLTFGTQLFDTLLQGDVRRLYDEARTRQRRQRLDFVFTSMIPWISDKPWEFAYDIGRRSFLATGELHFVRNVLTNVPADPIVKTDGPLRILVAAAQPVGFGKLSIDQEVEVIRRGFQSLIEARLATVDVLARTTPNELHGTLSSKHYQIVHFIGHGVFDTKKQEGCLLFVNERDGEYPLGERALREIFCGRGLSLVFLNACESGRGGRGGRGADFNKGVAQSLVAHGLPALVANQYSVLDGSATAFARHFYWSLAQGLSVGQAAREARIAVNYLLDGEPIDWAVPVLYARDPSMRLCSALTTAAPPPAATSARAATRRSIAGRDSKVAVWDVDDAFPSIDATLNALNHSQTVFGFERVYVSTPLDVWDINREGRNYLRADRVAARLKHRAAVLGADVLVCITRHWMRDEKWLNLYGWWPDQGKPAVALLSTAGFEDELEPEGPETDRAIANAIVSCLAGYYGEVGTHATGAADCPLSFNKKRDFAHVIGMQRFDPSCRKRLTAKLGPKLNALDALLRVFD